MYLLWIFGGFDISPMWMSPWLNCLKSASSALHCMYYSPLFAKWSLYGLYIIHCRSPAEARSDLFGLHFPTPAHINMDHCGLAFQSSSFLYCTRVSIIRRIPEQAQTTQWVVSITSITELHCSFQSGSIWSCFLRPLSDWTSLLNTPGSCLWMLEMNL